MIGTAGLIFPIHGTNYLHPTFLQYFMQIEVTCIVILCNNDRVSLKVAPDLFYSVFGVHVYLSDLFLRYPFQLFIQETEHLAVCLDLVSFLDKTVPFIREYDILHIHPVIPYRLHDLI
jgi:hypothetical protein